MKVIAFNGSPKSTGNTGYAIDLVAKGLKNEGIEVEVINIGSQQIKGCTGCYNCAMKKTGECIIKTDNVNEYINKIKEADGILLASPTYFSNIPGTMKNFLDRAFLVHSYGFDVSPLRYKVGAAVVAVRRSGGIPTADALNKFLSIGEMIIPASSYWNVIHGAMPGEAEQDEEGKQIMRMLGKNMAYSLKMKEAAKHIKAPEPEQKIMTNFVR